MQLRPKLHRPHRARVILAGNQLITYRPTSWRACAMKSAEKIGREKSADFYRPIFVGRVSPHIDIAKGYEVLTALEQFN